MKIFVKAVATMLIVVYVGLFTIIAKQHYQSVVTQASFSDAEVHQIYNNLLKFTGIPSSLMPTLVIVNSDEINAYADTVNWEIGINSGMLKFCDTKDEVASVLAHEIGHIMMEHSALNPKNDDSQQAMLEGNADKYGIYLLLRAGYDACQAKNLWIKLRDTEGDYEINSGHPNYSYRAWQLAFPYCDYYNRGD